MIIAVDGPAASGKGTISAALAAHYGLPHLDTGLLYRAVGMSVSQFIDTPELEEKAVYAAQNLNLGAMDIALLTSAGAGVNASKIAVFNGVRAALLDMQKSFAHQAGGAVLDGRDIGTVIAPNADAKLFIVADPQARANRRFAQLQSRGDTVSLEAILRDIIERDSRDANAPHGGFRKADDAILLDTTNLGIEASIRQAIAHVDAVMRT